MRCYFIIKLFFFIFLACEGTISDVATTKENDKITDINPSPLQKIFQSLLHLKQTDSNDNQIPAITANEIYGEFDKEMVLHFRILASLILILGVAILVWGFPDAIKAIQEIQRKGWWDILLSMINRVLSGPTDPGLKENEMDGIAIKPISKITVLPVALPKEPPKPELPPPEMDVILTLDCGNERTILTMFARSNKCPKLPEDAVACSEINISPILTKTNILSVDVHIEAIKEVIDYTKAASLLSGYIAIGSPTLFMRRKAKARGQLWRRFASKAKAETQLLPIDESSFEPSAKSAAFYGWLLHKNTIHQPKPVNFFRIGSEIAIFGIVLSSVTVLTLWETYSNTPTPSCDSSFDYVANGFSEFSVTLQKQDKRYSPIPKDEIKSKCSQLYDCIGITYFVSSRKFAGRENWVMCQGMEEGFHTIGGVENTKERFSSYVMDLLENGKGSKMGVCTRAGEGHCEKCKEAVKEFVKTDPQAEAFKNVVSCEEVKNSIWWDFSDFQTSDQVSKHYCGNEIEGKIVNCECAQNTIPKHVFFGTWKNTFLEYLTIPLDKVVPAESDKYTSDLQEAAYLKGYDEKCSIALKDNECTRLRRIV